MNWVGYKVHRSETGDEGYPDLITQVSTTVATTADFVMGAPIAPDLANRQLLPGTPWLDSGYVVADLLGSAPRDHHSDVVGPALSSSSRQGRAGQGYDGHSVASAWEAQQACCPQGHCRVTWPPGHSQEGHAVIRLRCDKATGDTGAVRPACTSSTQSPRQITVKPQALHEAIAAAQARQATPEVKAQYALRAGVESTLSPGARRFALRRSRYSGWATTHLPQTIHATAMTGGRIADGVRKGGTAQPKRRPGHCARLVPSALFGLAAGEASATPS
jgi:transposase